MIKVELIITKAYVPCFARYQKSGSLYIYVYANIYVLKHQHLCEHTNTGTYYSCNVFTTPACM